MERWCAGVIDGAGLARGEMGEDLLDEFGRFDVRDDAQRTVTHATVFDVDVEDALEPLHPTHGSATRRNPTATADAFRNGWLHTGDVVRRDERERFHYVSRIKDMIRRSGENIAAAEVEEVIMRHPGVRLAAVLAVEDELRGEEVLAYVVPGDDVPQEDVSPEVLSAFCADRLARFKVPRYWKYRDDLPRTPSEHPQGGAAGRAR